ncbi:glycosyltransferase family 2 protein, partial [Thioclava sp. BHET1]
MKCGVITPIGPGHAGYYAERGRPSIERAAGYSQGPFSEILLYAMDDTQGAHGRSNRRNAAIAQAQAEGVEWLFFLDADDELAANAFETFGKCLAAEPELDALWGLICEFDAQGNPSLREGQPETLSSYAEFLATPPFFAVQIGMFVRTEAVARFGFDITMD